MDSSNVQKANKTLFLQGLLTAVPLMIQTGITGIGYGVIAFQSGLSWLQTVLMSLIVFAGSSQFTAVGMLATAATIPVAPIIFTCFLINLRHLLYSTSLVSYLQNWSLGKQGLASFGITDESYAVTISYFTAHGSSFPYMLGVNAGIYLSWFAGSALGAGLGSVLKNPMAWGLDFIMPACFIALLIPMLISWKEVVVAVAAGIFALVGSALLPGKWYIILAALAATAIGGGLDQKWTTKSI